MRNLKKFANYTKEMLAGPGDIYLASRPRGMYASKADNGRVIIIGGSENFHGAPTLASNAAYATLGALRSGIGYAFTFVPKSVVGPVRSLSPNIIVKPLSGDSLNSADLKMLKEAVKHADSIAIGPGIGREEESLEASADLITYIIGLGKRVVVDADALHAIKLIHKKLGKNVLLTPNGHEFSLFYEKKLNPRDLSARIKAAIKVATELDTNLLLKGHETVVTDGENLKIAVSHTATLATMGTGDVLTGLIAGFAARNQDMFKAAVAGAYVQALAGDELYLQKGNHILATDIIDFIPSAIKEFDKNCQ